MICDDCQGLEIEKNNHIEMGKSVPAGAEGTDRSKETEQKGMMKKESGKTSKGL